MLKNADGKEVPKKDDVIETEIWKWLGGLKIFAATYLEQPTVLGRKVMPT